MPYHLLLGTERRLRGNVSSFKPKHKQKESQYSVQSQFSRSYQQIESCPQQFVCALAEELWSVGHFSLRGCSTKSTELLLIISIGTDAPKVGMLLSAKGIYSIKFVSKTHWGMRDLIKIAAERKINRQCLLVHQQR